MHNVHVGYMLYRALNVLGILYSWWELNLAVESKFAIARILVHLNFDALVREFGDCNINHQTTKFNYPQKFPAIWYHA